MRKSIIILAVIVLFMMAGGLHAQEVPDIELEQLRVERNDINLQIMRLQAQGQLLASQLQEYIEKYVSDKSAIKANISALRKRGQDVGKSIADLEKPEPAKE